MEMVECPVCKKRCPRDFYPLCTCDAAGKGKDQGKKKGTKTKKTGKA